MTKPMPTSCIKEHPSPSWLKFNLLLETVDSDDETGHLFVADIEFDKKKDTERKHMYNGIIAPVIEKQKIMEANERSIYQLLELYGKTDRNNPKAYSCAKKYHAQ